VSWGHQREHSPFEYVGDRSKTGVLSNWLAYLGLVHGVDGHSNKSALIPPPLIDLERLAYQSRRLQSDDAPAKAGGGAMRSLRRRLSPQTIGELVVRYNGGEDSPALSREYGISKNGLRQLLLAEGVTLRRQPMTPRDAKRAVLLYESGMTVEQVVGQIGYSYSTIRKMLHVKGVAMRATCIRKRPALDE
jgi:hypothetical protein